MGSSDTLARIASASTARKFGIQLHRPKRVSYFYPFPLDIRLGAVGGLHGLHKQPNAWRKTCTMALWVLVIFY